MSFPVVIDTNVFISALLRSPSKPRQVIRYCLEGRIIPLMGAALFTEYESVLSRSALFNNSMLSRIEREELFGAFLSVCRWVQIHYLWRPNLKDEGDNHLIELAMAGNAVAIVTGNTKDFKQAELLFPHIDIVTVTQFLQQRSH